MAKKEFRYSVNTLAGCKYAILKDLKKKYQAEKSYRNRLFWSTLASMITTGLSLVDDRIYRIRSRNLELTRAPVYVLGHWRSGTTLLHNLLCSYRDTAYPTTYQTVFPNNLFFLKGLMKRIMQHHLPEHRLVDRVRMHVNYPQEEDFALGNEAGFSFYYWFYYPRDYQGISDEYLSLANIDSSRADLYRKRYTRFIKRCMLNAGGSQYIAKNPPNMARIPFLQGLFPESRFIYIERNPYEVLSSTYSFFKGFLKPLQLQDMTDEALWEFIFATYRQLYKTYQDDKHLITPSRLFELKFEELVADPAHILNELERGILHDLEPDKAKLKAQLEVHRKHRINAYDFEQSFIDRVNTELGPLIQKQGYPLL